jgi:hypothetical protein
MQSPLRLLERLAAVALSLAAASCDLGLSLDEADACKPLPATTTAIFDNGQLNVSKLFDFCDTVLPRQYKLFRFTDVPGLIADNDGYTGEWTFPSDALMVKPVGSAAEMRWGFTPGKVCGRRWNDCTPKGDLVCVDIKTPAHNVWTPVGVEGSSVFDRGVATAMVGDAMYAVRPFLRSEVWKGDPKTGVFELVTKDFLPMTQLEAETATAGVAIGHGTDLWFLADKRKFRFDTVAKKWFDEGALSHTVPPFSNAVELGGKLYIIRNIKDVLNKDDGPMMVFDPADGSLKKFGGMGGGPKALAFKRAGKPVFGPWSVCPAGTPPCNDNGFRALDVATLTFTDEPYSLPQGVQPTIALDFEDFDLVGTQDGRMFRVDAKTTAVTEIKPLGDLGCAGKQIHRTYALAGAITAGGSGYVLGGENNTYGVYVYLP